VALVLLNALVTKPLTLVTATFVVLDVQAPTVTREVLKGALAST